MISKDKQVVETELNSHIMVHHYCSEEYLFQTVTMYDENERERVFQDIIENKSWYWGRFGDGHRAAYMKRRIMAETQMYQDFIQKYWQLKEPCPVYFYIYPHFSPQLVEEKLQQRQEHDEPHTKYLLIDINDLDNTANISFTISDSLISYKKGLIKERASYNSSNPISECADHGNIFHISEISQLIAKYRENEHLNFEVQVWDRDVLHRWLKRKKYVKVGRDHEGLHDEISLNFFDDPGRDI